MKNTGRKLIVSVILISSFIACDGVFLSCSETTEATKQEHHLCGAYTDQRQPSSQELELFNNVMEKEAPGIVYTPISVATQVVAGLNYRFRCSCSETDGDKVCYYIVTIFQPLSGDPVLSSIEEEK